MTKSYKNFRSSQFASSLLTAKTELLLKIYLLKDPARASLLALAESICIIVYCNH